MHIPEEIQAAIARIVAGDPRITTRELNARLAAEVNRYNARPQADLGGLSPAALSQLLGGDWHRTGPLRVAEDLPVELVRDVPFLADARALLTYVGEHGPVKLTATDALPRAAMLALIPRLRIPRYPGLWSEERVGKAPKESDYPWLGLIRATIRFAGLVAARGPMRLTPKGRRVLEDSCAGKLYSLLFRTLFREVNLRWLFDTDGYDELQPTLAYTFYRLPKAARDWARVEDLVDACWLPTARPEPRVVTEDFHDMTGAAFQHRVLDPLEQFGLVEHRRVEGTPAWMDRGEYRVTPLYDRVVLVDIR